jgi:lysophospholipase L1-like esterase
VPAGLTPVHDETVAGQALEVRYVAIGDSFTEGVGDELPDGRVRGWADLVAQGLAEGLAPKGARVHYANLAIRGRLLDRIVGEQLELALALEPTLISINGGGNDVLRPGGDPRALAARFAGVVDRVAASGAQLLLTSGADPTAGLPLRSRIAPRADELNTLVRALATERGVPYADNWSDRELARSPYWAPDRLHLGPVGHARVAARVLATLGLPAPRSWVLEAPGPVLPPGLRGELAYYRRHVLPWVARRVTRRSSGDGRVPKHPAWTEVPPPR